MVPGEGRATFKALDRTDTYRQTSALNWDTPRGFVPGVLAGFPEPSLVQNPASQPQEQQRVQHTPTPGSDPLGREPAPAWPPTAPHLEAFSRGLSCGGCQQGRWICGDQ